VDHIGFDKNHLHLMINSTPKLSPLQIVRKLKQESTIKIWEQIDLSNYFWKEKTFWADGYFICSCGEISSNVIEKYIQNQGGNSSSKLKT
jgi:putative transposase